MPQSTAANNPKPSNKRGRPKKKSQPIPSDSPDEHQQERAEENVDPSTNPATTKNKRGDGKGCAFSFKSYTKSLSKMYVVVKNASELTAIQISKSWAFTAHTCTFPPLTSRISSFITDEAAETFSKDLSNVSASIYGAKLTLARLEVERLRLENERLRLSANQLQQIHSLVASTGQLHNAAYIMQLVAHTGVTAKNSSSIAVTNNSAENVDTSLSMPDNQFGASHAPPSMSDGLPAGVNFSGFPLPFSNSTASGSSDFVQGSSNDSHMYNTFNPYASHPSAQASTSNPVYNFGMNSYDSTTMTNFGMMDNGSNALHF
jgi:hypothetical protein